MEYAVEHAKLTDAMASRLKTAEARLDAGGLWVPDVDQSLLMLKRLRQEAVDASTREAALEDIVSRGAVQVTTGLLISHRTSVEVQLEGFGVILALTAVASTPSSIIVEGAPSPAPVVVLSGIPGLRADGNAEARISPRPPALSKLSPSTRGGNPSPLRKLVAASRPPPSASSEMTDRLQVDDAISLHPGFSGRVDPHERRLRAVSDAGGVDAAVAAMLAHPSEAGVHGVCCDVMTAVCNGTDAGEVSRRRARAARAGALDRLTSTLRSFHADGDVQQKAAAALKMICIGEDEEAQAHRTRATETGGIEALCLALLQRPWHDALQETSAKTLSIICFGGDAAGRARKMRAADAGAIDAMCAACINYPPETAAAREALRTLVALLAGLDTLGKARQQRAAESGALRIVIKALTDGAHGGETTRFKAARYRALRNLTRNHEGLQQAAKEHGAKTEWL